MITYSCDRSQVFDQYQSITGGWDKRDTISFQLADMDTVPYYNLYFNIRNNDDYPYSNLFIISDIKFPNGKVITDTLEYMMAAPDGTWLGTGFGALKENKLFYKEKIRFTEEGTYEVQVRQAMRKNGEINKINSLEGITDVGFRIEFSKP
ncbi:gliding motility lipoprotein GldH [Aquimarina sp. ERC-38]|uniref:gliding motility lipoprotein GldH n=1 Tax=Aquimarina sp. ERC-38 TaxID=2949996 RepID=UPI002245A6D4|nr:gliding motility lipoprotein GldH [Aquimarina sp. ERC-38]UZO82036.1 gliding motility lipoprotein GldH [Aquimarina sp. ERC-38]